MHTYRKVGDQFEVGYFEPGFKTNDGETLVACWTVLSIHRTETAAMRRVNYLNGGAVA